MLQLDPRNDLTRLAGLAVWLSVGLFLPLCTDPSVMPLATAALYLVFGALFFIGYDPRMQQRRAFALLLLLGQTVSALLLIRIHPYFMMTGLLVITGWQIALHLALWQALLWIGVQSVAGGTLLADKIGLPLLISSVGAVVGFQLFALACADLARRERDARTALNAAMADLAAAQQSLLTQERASERLRIARDLHDDLGHGIMSMGLLAATAEIEAGDEAARFRAAALKRQASGLLTQLRATVGGLRQGDEPAAAQIDLARALAAVSDASEWPLMIRIDVVGDAGSVPVEQGIAVVRLVREAIINAVRHAGSAAREVHVRLDAAPGQLQVDVRDDGRGAAVTRFGNGLSGMRERIEALGGTFDVAAAPDEGWSVSATIPRLAP